MAVTEAGAFVALGALGLVVFRLGAAWFNPAAGALAAPIVLTRDPVLDFGARAYVDIPYLALVLGALLVETRRPRAGAPVLALLASRACCAPRPGCSPPPTSRGCGPGAARRAPHRPGRGRAPLLWALADLVVAGDPLHSLTGTREGTRELGQDHRSRRRAAHRPAPARRDPARAGPRRRGRRRAARARLPAPARAAGRGGGALALAAFCVLAAAGLPILGRYLLLPAALLAIFCGAGAFGWALLPRGDRAAALGLVRGADPRAPRRLRPRPGPAGSMPCAPRSPARTTSSATSPRSCAAPGRSGRRAGR